MILLVDMMQWQKKIGCDADPSLKAIWRDGQVARYAGFPLG